MLNYIPDTLGSFLLFIYNTVGLHSYGLALIIFTIIVKFILLPLNIKQTKSMSKIQELNPKLQELQKRYKDDRQQLQIETMKLYQENKVSPAAGCLPLLIQLPILFSLFYVISMPLTYMLKMSGDQVDALKKTFGVTLSGYPQPEIIKIFDPAKVDLSKDLVDKIVDLQKGMDFLGINLTSIPKVLNVGSVEFFVAMIIPVLAVVTTYLSTKLSFSSTSHSVANNPMQKSMLYIAPVLTAVFSFQFPVGLALYWTVGYVFQIFQQLYMNKYVLKKKEAMVK